MPKLEKITSAIFPQLYSAFLKDDDPLSSETDWRHVFDYAWQGQENYCGYAMFDGDNVVGMMGMVFSHRQFQGNHEKLCNIHTWWVHEAYRGHSISMLRPIITLAKNYTVTHFTPCDTIRALTRRLGFSEISTQLRILLPMKTVRNEAVVIIHDFEAMENQLSGESLRIHQDHAPYGCNGIVLRKNSQTCYILYTFVVRHRLPYIHIHYVSDFELFSQCERSIRSKLLKHHEAWFVAMDERLVGNHRFRRSFRFWAPANGMFKSTTLQASQIDNLYTDVVMLRLTTLPHITHEIRERIRRFTKRPRGS